MDSLTGRFATSKAGHDKSRLYVILAVEGDFVYLCDGKNRSALKPKKKRTKHIQMINNTVEDALLEKLRNRETVTDEQIKYALKLYQQQKFN